MSVQRLHTGPRLSQAVVSNGTVYLAAQLADDLSADVAEQTRQTLGRIDRLLAEVGSGREKILFATILLADIASFAEMNGAWEAWLPSGHAPARNCIETPFSNAKIKVEISVIAAI